MAIPIATNDLRYGRTCVRCVRALRVLQTIATVLHFFSTVFFYITITTLYLFRVYVFCVTKHMNAFCVYVCGTLVFYNLDSFAVAHKQEFDINKELEQDILNRLTWILDK